MGLGWFSLARLKALCALLGSTLTFASSQFHLPGWATGLAALLTFIAVWQVPNLVPHPATGEPVNPLELVPKLPLDDGEGPAVG